MSVPSQIPIKSHIANGATTIFAFDFFISSGSDLVVQVDGVVLTYNVDYTVTGVGISSGGNVTLNSPPVATAVVTLYRDTAIERLDDFQTGGDLEADELDRQLDRIWQTLQELFNGSKASARVVRVPAGDSLSELPPASQRALQLLGFDATGNVVLSAPASGSAAALALLLSSSSTPLQGAGAIGYNNSLSYPAGSLGKWVKELVATSSEYKRLKADLGAVGDGVADDTAALRNAIATLPEGSALVFDGYFRITDTVVWNRRVNPICYGSNQGLVLDVGSSKDGVVFVGTSVPLLLGLNNINVRLNVYGAANCCRYAVTLTRVDRSFIELNVRAGAVAFGVRARGMLINRVGIDSSGNYAPPASLPVTAGLAASHMVVENYGVPSSAFVSVSVTGTATPAVVTWAGHGFTVDQPVVFDETGTAPPSPFVPGKPYFVRNPTTNTFELSDVRTGASIASLSAGTSPRMATCAPVASNSNLIYINGEGGAQGYVQVPMPGEGANTLCGELEGLTGAPFFVEDSLGFRIENLRMEQNGAGSTIKNSLGFAVGDGVTYLGGPTYPSTITLQNCRSYKIGDGFYGKLVIDSASRGGTLGSMMTPDANSITVADPTCVQSAGIAVSTTDKVLASGPGAPTMATLFVNPFFDIFNDADPAVGPPVGVSMEGGYTAGDLVKETSVTYDRSPSVTALKCLSRGSSITNGAVITPGVQPWRGANEWMSIFIPIRMISAAYRAEVYIDDGVTYHFIGQTKSGGVWEEIRGAAKLIQGNNWRVRIAIANASTNAYTGGVQYYLGGINVVKGAIPPATIENSLARLTYVSTSIAYTPFRQGATAVVGTAPPVAYFAVGNGSAADWKQIT